MNTRISMERKKKEKRGYENLHRANGNYFACFFFFFYNFRRFLLVEFPPTNIIKDFSTLFVLQFTGNSEKNIGNDFPIRLISMQISKFVDSNGDKEREFEKRS